MSKTVNGLIFSIAVLMAAATSAGAETHDILSSREGCIRKSGQSGRNTATFSARRCTSGARFSGSFSLDPFLGNRRLYVKEGGRSLFVRIDEDAVDVFKVKVPGCQVSASPRRSNVVGDCDGVVVKYDSRPLLVGFGGNVVLFDPYTGRAQGVLDSDSLVWTDRSDIPQLQATEHWWGEGVFDLLVSAEINAGHTGLDYISVTHSILANVGRYDQDCESLGPDSERFFCFPVYPLFPINDASAVLFDAFPNAITAGVGLSTVAMCRDNFNRVTVPRHAQRVLIDCIGNDISYYPTESDVFITAGYLDLIFEARRRAPFADIVVADEFPRFDSEFNNERTNRIDAWVSQVLDSAPEQARMVDLYELAGLTFADYADNVHLSDTGMLKVSVAIADEVFE